MYYEWRKYGKAGQITGIGKRIRDRRVELGISGIELAERIGVSKQTASGYERMLDGLERLRKKGI